MLNKALVWLIGSIIASALYRAGGYGKPFKSWQRDWLCPACVYGVLLFFWQPLIWWQYLLFLPAYGLLGGALTTYLDSIFGYDNFWVAGFLCGLAAFPLYWAGISWYAILIRAVVVGILWGGWCKIFGNDNVEELGRGFFISATIPLLLI